MEIIIPILCRCIILYIVVYLQGCALYSPGAYYNFCVYFCTIFHWLGSKMFLYKTQTRNFAWYYKLPYILISMSYVILLYSYYNYHGLYHMTQMNQPRLNIDDSYLKLLLYRQFRLYHQIIQKYTYLNTPHLLNKFDQCDIIYKTITINRPCE